MDKILAEDIARETEKVNKSFSQMMDLCIKLADERDALKRGKDKRDGWITRRGDEVRKLRSQNAELKRQRDEVLGKSPLFEKNKAEASELKAEDLKPALILALSQRDIALRSVKKVHEIHNLLETWFSKEENNIGDVEDDYKIITEISRILKWHIGEKRGV